MGYIIFRFIFMLFCVSAGFFLNILAGREDFPLYLGPIIGFFAGCFIVAIEIGMVRAKTKALIAGIIGVILGLVITNLIVHTFAFLYGSNFLPYIVRPVLAILLCYLGIMIVLRRKDEITFSAPFLKWAGEGDESRFKILDTSVIIDGRIADICQTAFIEGILIVPRFVLTELQFIADSSDALKRNRGRRGLDILKKIQKSKHLKVLIHDLDFPELTTVDAKLLKLSKALNGKVVTNDYNLNKVADLEHITVLNINDLANALRPVVLPGEIMKVKIVKEGKEFNQGVAYLDDGTMIVIEEGKSCLGQLVGIKVTSVLQTSAGKMIFGRIKH